MKIGILCGGFGDEREISLKSSESIFNALSNRGHDIICLDPVLIENDIRNKAIFSHKEALDLKKNKADCYLSCIREFRESDVEIVFIGLHGGEGEDGRIQALLELLGMPFTGSDSRASAVGMDKDMSKKLFRQDGGSTADWVLIKDKKSMNKKCIQGLGLPLVIKGNHQGSSVGMTIIDDKKDLLPAVSRALSCDSMAIAEAYIGGRELTVGILEGEVLPVVEIAPKTGFYDYHAKYTKGASDYFAPADLNDDIREEVQKQAMIAWEVLKLKNYARIDFRLDEKKIPYFLEANTLPGMTELSLIPMAGKAAGMDFGSLLEKIINGALSRFKREQK